MESLELHNKLSEMTSNIDKRLIDMEYFRVIFSLLTNKKKPEYQAVIVNSTFFRSMTFASFKSLVMDFCILLDNKEHYSIGKLLNMIGSNYKLINWQRNMDIKDFKKIKNKFIKIQKSDESATLKLLRDKYFAHDDSKKNLASFKLKYESTWKLLNDLQEIFNSLSLHLIASQTLYDNIPEPQEITKLHRYKLMRNHIFDILKDDPSNKQNNQLVGIMRGREV